MSKAFNKPEFKIVTFTELDVITLSFDENNPVGKVSGEKSTFTPDDFGF